MSAIEFEPWPKIARLNRDIVVTEKIDGTNAAIVIKTFNEVDWVGSLADVNDRKLFAGDASKLVAQVGESLIFAQSRKRFITPGSDNFGFANWVKQNAEKLVEYLGVGRHYGEWWGYGIQSGYGMPRGERFFSLFNTSRWYEHVVPLAGITGLRVVPTLYKGPFSEVEIQAALAYLKWNGSAAAKDTDLVTQKQDAEGIVVFHTAANTAFKVTLKGDEAPKGAAGHALDTEK